METLDTMPEGASGIVEDIGGGITFLSRITAMGFTPGVQVYIVKNQGRGPLIAWLRDTKVALGRREAARITLKRIK